MTRHAPPASRRPRPAQVLAGIVLAAAACSAPVLDVPFGQGAAATSTPQPVIPTPPPPPSMLVVCLAEEPNTLYLYDSPNASARTLLPALYDGPIDILGYRPTPVILDALPSIEAGTVRLEPVSISSGDLYFNPETMLPETMAPGKPFLPSGCTSTDCVRRFEGGQTQIDRMVVEFRLLPDLVWSDGEPLTAHDSVFSFDLQADPRTPGLKDQVNRTTSYEAVDDLTVRWTGIPGFFDVEFATNFWTPLPRHVLDGLDPSELPGHEAARTTPLGWGPYAIERWTPGESIDFVANPNYRRAGEGAPGFERLHVRFVGRDPGAALQQILTGECDVLEESLVGIENLDTLRDLAAQDRLRWQSAPGSLLERLDFAVAPADDRPAILADVGVRRALAACIDRQGLIDSLLGAGFAGPAGFLPGGHPLAASESLPAYDPVAGAAALTELGWIDHDQDPQTPRVAQGAPDVAGGTELVLSLLTTPDDLHQRIAAAIADGLSGCGARVRIEALDPAVVYAPWPDGPAFGRRFDLVVWPWLQWLATSCEVFTSAEIASDDNPEGSNASGYREAVFDEACRQAQIGPVGGEETSLAVGRTQSLLAEALPALPLFYRPRFAVSAPGICGLEVDATAPLLWNLEDLRADGC